MNVVNDRIMRAVCALFLICVGNLAQAAAPCPTISMSPTPTALPAAALQTSYSATLSAGGSSATPFDYEITSGVLPTGLTLDAASGAISGTPTQGGAFIVTATATDANGCSGGRTYTLDVVPAVLSTTPTNGASSIAVNSTITINFTEAVNVTASTFSLQCPSGTPVAFTLSPAAPGGASSFTLTPTSNLPAGTTCTATVAASTVTSVSDSLAMASDYSFTFSTGTQPFVSSTVPANAATNISTTSTIALTFNESVNASSTAFTLECPSGTPQAFTTSASPATTFTLTPTSPLPAGAVCTVTAVAAQITDSATSSIHPASDYTFSFTVDAAPTVTSTTPTSGATNISLTTTVTFSFDKSVNVTATAFTLQCPSGTPEAFTISPAPPGNATTFTLTPSAPLPAGTTCVATAVANQIADSVGTHMASNSSVSFTTDTPPTVSSTTPSNGATSISGTAPISIVFSKAVNVTASAFTLQCPSGTPEAFTLSPAPPGGVLTFTLTPTAALPAGTVCTVTVVASQVTDTTPGTAMTANYTFSFTTDVAPTVTSTTPANNATVIDTTNVVFNFSKAVNITASAFTLQCPSGTPVAFTIAPAPPGGVATFTLTPTAALPPNVTCSASAIASQITDAVGTHLASDFTFTFNTIPPPPVATNDTYPQTVIGNVSIDSSRIPYSVTTNDSSQTAFTITAFDATSANGGTVTMVTSGANMGQFTYNPPAGFTGTDTFTYTITSTGGSATGTVSVLVANPIWFINNAGAAGDGRLSSPFNSIAAFQAVNNGAVGHPAVNQGIFVYDSATGYVGPLTLLNGQMLVGQDATQSLAQILGIAVPSGSATLPATGGSANNVSISATGNAVTVASNNTIEGLTIGNATGIGLTGAAIGTLKLRDMSVTNGSGSAIQLSGGTVDAILNTVSSNGGNNGISLSTINGSFDVEGGGASDPANTTRGRTTAKQGGGAIVLGSGGTVAGATGAGVFATGAVTLTLRNMVIQNNGGSSLNTGSDGLSVSGASSLTLDNTQITGQAGNNGLHGTNVGGATIQHSEIFNNATSTSVNPVTTWNVRFDNLAGTSTVSNSLMHHSYANVFGVVDTGAIATTLTATNIDVHDAATGDCFYIEGDNTSAAAHAITFTGSSAENCTDVGFLYNGNKSSGGSVTVTQSAFELNGGNNEGGADIAIAHQGVGQMLTYDIESNTTRQQLEVATGTSISLDLGGTSTAATSMIGKILNNVVGNKTVPASGSDFDAAIAMQANGAGTLTANVAGNQTFEAIEGLAVLASGTTDQINVSVSGNDFEDQANDINDYAGMELTAGGAGGNDVICSYIHGNTKFDASNQGVGAVIVDAMGTTSIHLQGYAGAANDVVAIQNFLDTTATSVNPPSVDAGDTGTVSGQGSCPPLP